MTETVFSSIGNPANKDILNNLLGSNGDIIKAVNSNFKNAVKETQKIAPYFKAKTPEKTALNIWNFLKQKINYQKDKSGYQFVRLPKRFLNEKTGDCKSYSLFTAGVLKNIYPNAKVLLRYTSYSNINIPTHVYCILLIDNQKIIIDAVYSKFNQEKPYKHKTDYEMKIYTLAGIDDDVISGRKGKGKLKAAIKTATQAVKTAVKQGTQAVKQGTQAVKQGAEAVKKGGAKTLLIAPARAAFLGLLLVNLKGLASKIKKAAETQPEKLKDLWVKKFGGEYNQLIETANKGASKKPIGYIPDDEEIGSASATVAAIAAATPIIIAIVPLLKQILPKKDFEESGKTTDLEETAAKTAAETPQQTTADEETTTSSGDFFQKNKVLILGGAAALALFFIMKKK